MEILRNIFEKKVLSTVLTLNLVKTALYSALLVPTPENLLTQINPPFYGPFVSCKHFNLVGRNILPKFDLPSFDGLSIEHCKYS